MIFGKHINKYYIKHLPVLLLGILALLLVDFFQLKVPELYNMVISGIDEGIIENNNTVYLFDMTFLIDKICLPMLGIIATLIVGRFLWRICFFGTAIKVETSIRYEMFDHSKDLSHQYYQKNKVGNLMSLYTNDLETINECFGDGILMLFDALLLGTLALVKMGRMNIWLTLLSLIPTMLLLAVGTIVGKYMMQKWEARQAAFSSLSDFTQENFSGIAVIKAFVKEFSEIWSFKKLNK